MKRLMINLLAVCLLLTMLAPAAYATETTETTEATEAVTEAPKPSDSCGENLTWSFSGGTLTVTGSGAMDDFTDGAPWDAHSGSIQKVVLSGGVTTVGAGAFDGCSSLTAIDFGSSLKEIGAEAFKSCEGLTTISLPSTFRRFGASCFEGCTNLTTVYCAGSMPSFNSNCLWNGNYITVYCPTNNPWPQQYVEELETNFHGRLEILTSDGTDLYVYETTEATNAPTTEPETEPTTVPTTEPATEPTVETTVPETEAPTEVTEENTAPTEETAEETEEAEEEGKKSVSGILIGVFILSGTLSLVLIGALVFRGRRGGRYTE